MNRLRYRELLWALGLLLSALGAFNSDVPAEILHSDSFSGPDNIRPSGWTVIEEPLQETLYWRRIEGQYNTGNGDNIPSPDGYSFSILNQEGSQNWTDYETAASFWMPQSNGRVILVGRWKDRNNHYEAYIMAGADQRIIGIEKIVDGKRENLGRAVNGLKNVRIPNIENGTSTKDSHLFTFTIKENRLDVRLDDIPYLSVTDESFKTGTTGVGEWFNEVYFDNFLVTSLTGAAATAAATSIDSTGRQKSVFRLAIERAVSLSRANRLKQSLDRGGIENVDIVPNGADFDVLVGSYLTEDEAQRQLTTLSNQGIVAQAVVKVDAKGGVRLPGEKLQTYKILMKIFKDQAAAEQLKSSLESDAYFPVNIAQALGKYQVTVGDFETRAEAEKLADKMRSDGYIVAQIFTSDVLEGGFVVTPGTGPTAAMGGGQGDIFPTREIPRAILESPEWKKLDREKQKEVRDLIANEVKLQTEEKFSSALTGINKRLDSLDDNQRKIVQDIREQFRTRDEIQRDQKVRLQEMYAKADELMDAADYTKARQLLNQIRAEYPTDAQVDLKLRKLHYMENNIAFEGEEAVKVMMEGQLQIQLASIWNEAKQLEKSESYPSAIAKVQTYKNLLPPNDIDGIKKAEVYLTDLTRLNNAYQQKADQERQGLNSQWQKDRTYLLIGFIGLAVIITILAGLMIMGRINRNRERREIRATIQSLTMKPMMDIDDMEARQLAGGAQNQLPPRAAQAIAHQTQPEFQPDYPSAPLDESDAYAGAGNLDPLGGIGEEEPLEKMDDEALFGYAESEVAPDETQSDAAQDSLVLEEQDIEITQMEGQQPAGDGFDSLSLEMDSGFNPADAEVQSDLSSLQPADEQDSINLSLDDAEEEPALEEETVIDMSNGDNGGEEDNSLSLDMEETVMDSPGSESNFRAEYETEEESRPKAKPLVVAPGGGNSANAIYLQDFDQEDVGSQPLNWRGEYDYALLEVTNEDSYDGEGHCLKFSKPVGDGRAYCHCSFPDTSGKLQIQFDIKCTDKNKYLLGFYIERDQDFKNSIHTVIHRTESQSTPMLRIHGVPVPYVMGEWRRIRYDINLLSGVVNGYVNGQLVASNIKLDTNPEFLNTLAIRDNNPTTGELMLDNITIKKI